jgi:PAS domain S-box-containing protein
MNDLVVNLIQKAISSTTEGVTVADANSSDLELIFANQAFFEMSGYTREEIIGRNCRFLQGPKTDKNSVFEVRKALIERRKCVIELLNYRKDGTTFWNRLSIVPIFDNNQVTHFVGFQSDVTRLKEIQIKQHQDAVMRTTLQTVNEVILNFMNNLQYFRMRLEDSLNVKRELLIDFEQCFQDTLNKLTKINELERYREKELKSGTVLLDAEITKDS